MSWDNSFICDFCNEKFLTDKYNWSVHDDVDDVVHQCIFSGPVMLTGTVSFMIKDIEKTFHDCKKYISQ